MPIFFIKAIIFFIVQSFLFFVMLNRYGEESNTIWDMYFMTNIPTLLISYILGSILHMYFPIYFFVLMGIYYFLKKRWMADKSLKNIFLYFSINVYSACIMAILFSLSFSTASLIASFVAIAILILFIVLKMPYFGMYSIPVIYTALLFVKNSMLLNTAIKAMSGQFEHYLLLLDLVILFTGILVLFVLEVSYNRFIIFGNRERDEYRKILHYKKSNSDSAFKLPGVSI